VRTASVSASTDAPPRVSVLPRATFLTGVTGYPASAIAGSTSSPRASSAQEAKPETLRV
jgi:hypothetical protein